MNVRNIWNHEALDFTPWLAKNLDLLGEALGIDLELVQQESQTGDFYLDILAREVGSQLPVVIENQLEWTDHNHLGQLLTYAAGHDAHCLIWVSPNFRDEHRAAIDWINRWTGAEIEAYGVEVRAVRIDDSAATPEFRAVAFPNNWSDRVRPGFRGTMPQNQLYRDFFQPVVESLHSKGLTDRVTARANPSQYFPSGFPSINYHLSFWDGEGLIAALLWISTGDSARTNRIFDGLQERYRDEIEKELGMEARWDRFGNHPWAGISITRQGSIDGTPQELEEIRCWMVENLPKLKTAINPRLETVLNETQPVEAEPDSPDRRAKGGD